MPSWFAFQHNENKFTTRSVNGRSKPCPYPACGDGTKCSVTGELTNKNISLDGSRREQIRAHCALKLLRAVQFERKCTVNNNSLSLMDHIYKTIKKGQLLSE